MGWVELIKSKIGVSSNELIIISFLLSGLIVGYCYQWFFPESKNVNSLVYHAIDSLASVQKQQYVGTDISNQSLLKNENSSKKFVAIEKIVSGKINLNTASKLELMKLPGVGEKTAIKIIEYRKFKKFTSIDEIMNIKGIGPKKFEKMRDFLIVD